MIIRMALLLLASSCWSMNASLWYCTAQDNDHHQWEIQHPYRIAAMNRALEQCKKGSPIPKTCRIITKNCIAAGNEMVANRHWQCTAFDKAAMAWTSSFYPNRDDAALHANDTCKSNSSVPESCYINLVSCKDTP